MSHILMNTNTNKNLISLDEAINLTSKEIQENYKNHINPSLVFMFKILGFNKKFTKAQDCLVLDDEGNSYLDFLGAYGAINLGHNNPKIIEAIAKINELPNLIQTNLNPIASALAYNLAQITPAKLNKSFFCNSGAEAIEGALKLAKASSRKKGLLYCENSFHGKTAGALSVTGRKKYQEPFEPLLDNRYAVTYGDYQALEKALQENNDIAAFIIEPIQGEGGIIVPPEGYLQKVAEICKKHEVLLIIDEVQTGFGRTGDLFASDYEKISPDILCLAKSLGGGIMPIGAYVTTDEVWEKAYGSWEKALLHTSTFGGNTWACASAIASLEIIIEEELPKKAQEKGAYFTNKLKNLQKKYPLIKEIRGRGLMIGIEFEKTNTIFNKITMGKANKLSQEYLGSLIAVKLLNEYKIITAYTLNNPNVIRLEPPLTITKEQIDQCLNALEDILQKNKGILSLASSEAKTALKSFFKK